MIYKVLLLLLLGVGSAYAQDKCVSDTYGSDSGGASGGDYTGTTNGDKASCWASLDYADSNVGSGSQTICIWDDTYDSVTFDNNGTHTWQPCTGVALGDILISSVGASSNTVVDISTDGNTFTDVFAAAADVRGDDNGDNGTPIDPDTGTGISDDYDIPHYHFVDVNGNNNLVHGVRGIFSVKDQWWLYTFDRNRAGKPTGRRAIFRFGGGDGNIAEDVKGRYWGGSGFGEDKNATGYTVRDSDMGWIWSHAFALDGDCGNTYTTVDALIENTFLGPSVYSDGVQQDQSNHPTNVVPGDTRPTPANFPCRGGFIWRNITFRANGENAVDLKGGNDHLFENIIITRTMAENDWMLPPGLTTPESECGGNVLMRGSAADQFLQTIIRNVLIVDNAGAGGITGDSGQYDFANRIYNVSSINNTRRNTSTAPAYSESNYTGPNCDSAETAAYAPNYGNTPPIWNSIFLNETRAVQIYDNWSSLDIDHNVYHVDTVYDNDNDSVSFTDLASWQSHNSPSGADANSVEVASIQTVFPNLSNTVSYEVNYWTDDGDQILTDLDNGDYSRAATISGKNTLTGGGDFATTKSAGTNLTRLDLNEDANWLCCGWTDRHKDTVYIPHTGTEHTITNIQYQDHYNDGVEGYIDVTPAVSGLLPSGSAVHVAYASGNTSQQFGADISLLGTESDPDPQPTAERVDEADRDAEEDTSDNSVSISGTSLAIGTSVGGGGVPADYDTSVTTGADDCNHDVGESVSCSSDRVNLFQDANWIAIRDLGIPASSTVNTSSLCLTADSAQSGTRDVDLYVQTGCAAVQPTGLNGITTEIASALAGPFTFTTPDGAVSGTEYCWGGAGLVSVIQAAVDQGCWDENADIGIMLDEGGSTNRYFRSYDNASPGVPRLEVNATPPGGAGSATEVGAIVPVTVAGGTNITAGKLILNADATDSDAAAWTIEAFVPTFADFTTGTSNISNRTTLASTATCSSVPSWTAGTEYTLTDTECLGLTAMMQAVIDHASYDNRIGLVITGTGTRRAISYEGDSNKSIEIQYTEATASEGNFPVTASECDAEERKTTGVVNIVSTDLELGWEDLNTTNHLVGVCFDSVTIPQGNRVSEAYIQFQADLDTAGDVELEVYCEDVSNASVYAASTNNLSNRTTITDKITWRPDRWIGGDSKAAQRTPNIAPLIDQIVNRIGWSSGNRISCLIDEVNGLQTFRRAESEDGAGTAPFLHAKWTGTTTADITVSGADGTVTEDSGGTVDNTGGLGIGETP